MSKSETISKSYVSRFEMFSLTVPAGVLSFACWQTWGYFNIFSNKSQEKTAKKVLYLGTDEYRLFNTD